MTPMRVRLAIAAVLAAGAIAANADPLPTIVTYELSKSRGEARAVAHDPKSFWVGEIVARIEDRKPFSARPFKQPMTVNIGFVVGRDGHVISKDVVHSSGDAALDKAAMAVLDHAAPFPPMPAAIADDSLAFTVPLRFR